MNLCIERSEIVGVHKFFHANTYSLRNGFQHLFSNLLGIYRNVIVIRGVQRYLFVIKRLSLF